MTYRSEHSRVQRIADMKTGDLVVVVSTPGLSSSSDGIKVRPGEVLQCIDRSEGGAVVARPDGTRILVDDVTGHGIAVRLFWDPAEGWLPDTELERPS
jgi:hypothetical protein